MISKGEMEEHNENTIAQGQEELPIKQKGPRPEKLTKKERKQLFRAKQEAKKEAERIKAQKYKKVLPEELKNVCRDYMLKTCERGDDCRFIHDPKLCKRYFQHGNCKFGLNCRKKHQVNEELLRQNAEKFSSRRYQRTPTDCRDKSYKEHSLFERPQRKGRNTETFDPVTRPVDMRIVVDLGKAGEKLTSRLSSRDVLLVPNLFSDFCKGEIYERLVKEIGKFNPKELLKMWHGNEKLEGTHLIADDKIRVPNAEGKMTNWKEECPTFKIVIERIREFFGMDIKATRLNWYKDGSQYKPFHKDAAAVDPRKAKTQNFTVAVSFGATRDCGFERDDASRTLLSFPIGDGECYTFAEDTNILFRHGVLGGVNKEDSEGRISIIAWGWVDNIQKA